MFGHHGRKEAKMITVSAEVSKPSVYRNMQMTSGDTVGESDEDMVKIGRGSVVVAKFS